MNASNQHDNSAHENVDQKPTKGDCSMGQESSPLGKGNRIIKRFGGRHLIFRTKLGGWWMVPKPYVLVSSFRGVVWMFYGMGQIWFTHSKDREIEDWIVRKPRLLSKAVTDILNHIEPQLKDFVGYCNSQSIEGTIVLERKMLEFHWTFGNEPLPKEKEKPENSETLDSNFNDLVTAFVAAKEDLGL